MMRCGMPHANGRSPRPKPSPSSHVMRLSVALCLILACLLALPGLAFAHEGYKPSTVSFAPFGAGVFDGVAVNNSAGTSAGDIYAAGEGRTIYEFSPGGAILSEVEIPEADGERTEGIAVNSSSSSSAGDVYFVMIGAPPGGEPPGTPVPTHGAVYRLSGGTITPFVTGLDSSPSGITVGPSGEVYVLQSGRGESWIGDVLEFSSSGVPLNAGNPVVEGLKSPADVAVDSHGDLYVTACSSEAGTVEFAPLQGGGFSAPVTINPEAACGGADLAVDSRTGEVFLSDDNVVRVLDSSGTQVGGPALGSEVEGSGSEYRYFAVGVSEATGDIYAINSAAGFPTDSTLEAAEPAPETPSIEGESVGVFSVTEHEATLEATIDPQGLETTYEFLLGGQPVGSGRLAAGESDQHVSVRVSGLEPDHSYTYWVVATSSNGTRAGRKRSFVTDNAASPGAETSSATGVTRTSATLNGIVNRREAFEAQYIFEYGTTTGYGASAPTPPGAVKDGICGLICEIKEPVAVSETITGLQPGTTYHYRLVTGNYQGTGYGEDITFTTQFPGPEEAPSEVVTEPAEQTSSGFKLNGKLNPGNSPTTYYFEYIGNREAECLGIENCWPHTAQLGPITGDSQQQVPQIEVTDLRPAETYAYRLVASNAKGTLQGNRLTFTTPAARPPGEVIVQPAEATASGFRLGGKLNPENSPTSYYFLYKNVEDVECEDLEGCGTKVGEGGPLTGDAQQEVAPVEVTNLTPGKTYIYWMIATNAEGSTVRSNESTFTAPSSHARPLGGEEKAPSTQTPSNGSGQPETSSTPPVSGGPSLAPGVTTPLVSALANPKPKVLTRAQKLVKAMKQCGKDKSKRGRETCVKLARKRYGPLKKRRAAVNRE